MTTARHGRHVTYALHDDHVAALLEQAVHHAEHLGLGLRAADQPRTPAGTADADAAPVSAIV